MKLKLDSIDPFQPELHLTFDQEVILIGSGGDAHIQLDDRWVSRQHCEIRRQNKEVIVEDLKSKCGTLVNGKEVKHSPLRSGDELTIGVRTFRVSYRRVAVRRTTSKPHEVEHVGP